MRKYTINPSLFIFLCDLDASLVNKDFMRLPRDFLLRVLTKENGPGYNLSDGHTQINHIRSGAQGLRPLLSICR